MRIVDDAQMVDVENFDGELRNAGGLSGEKAPEALAKQRSLGQAGQGIKICQKMGSILLFQVLKRKGEVGRNLAQQFELLGTEHTGLGGAEQQGADRSLANSQ